MAEMPFYGSAGFLKQEMTSGHLSRILQEPCHSRVEDDPSLSGNEATDTTPPPPQLK